MIICHRTNWQPYECLDVFLNELGGYPKACSLLAMSSDIGKWWSGYCTEEPGCKKLFRVQGLHSFPDSVFKHRGCCGLDVPTQAHVLQCYSFEESETANTGYQGWAFEGSVPVSSASRASPCDHLPQRFPHHWWNRSHCHAFSDMIK